MIWKSFSRWLIQMIAPTVEARALYSASTDDREMVGCPFDFHATIELPTKMQKLVVDFRVSIHHPQSASKKA